MKKLSVLLSLLLSILFLGGCGGSPLSDQYSEEELRASTEEIIIHLNNKEYDAIVEQVEESLQDQLSADILRDAWSKFQDIGEYDSISKMVFQEKDDIAVVIAVVKYTNRNVQYTISYNTDMEIVGFYLK